MKQTIEEDIRLPPWRNSDLRCLGFHEA